MLTRNMPKDTYKAWNGTEVSLEDAKFYMSQPPDPNFSPEKNRQVIADSIIKAKKRWQALHKDRENDLRERTDALASYIDFIKNHDEIQNTPEKFFGKKYLAHLRGQHILQTLFKLKNGQTGIKTEYSSAPIENIYDSSSISIPVNDTDILV